MKTIHGEESYTLDTPELSLAVTERGGHLAPVVFHLAGRDVAPYSLSPWLPAEHEDQPVLLSVLRGDFLCLPFGGQKQGPPHGDPSNAAWQLVMVGDRSLVLVQDAADSGAHIEKHLSVCAGQHAIRIEHRISRLQGAYSYGTHPILDLSHLPQGTGRISTSPMRWLSTFPGFFAVPEAGETQSLKPDTRFNDLREVPLADGGTVDLSRWPALPGNEELVMMVNEPLSEAQPFAWSAMVMDGYVWYCLKDPADFPATLLWMSNGGRSQAPWNSRHTGRIGIEEVCSHFSNGVDISRQSPLAAEGIPTVRHFEADKTVSLKVIQAVAAVPEGFDRVASIVPAGDHAVKITAESGVSLTAALDWKFLAEPKK
ncbi:MAG TPA: hypothetical protein VFY13_09010 [Luteolibacter sp.]|nr:hypothetical protein [Luteolibacter sp.]